MLKRKGSSSVPILSTLNITMTVGVSSGIAPVNNMGKESIMWYMDMPNN